MRRNQFRRAFELCLVALISGGAVWAYVASHRPPITSPASVLAVSQPQQSESKLRKPDGEDQQIVSFVVLEAGPKDWDFSVTLRPDGDVLDINGLPIDLWGLLPNADEPIKIRVRVEDGRQNTIEAMRNVIKLIAAVLPPGQKCKITFHI